MIVKKIFYFIKEKLLFILFVFISMFVWIPILMILTGCFMGEEELYDYLSPIFLNSPKDVSWTLFPLYPTLRPIVKLLLDSPSFFVMFWNSCIQVIPILLGHLIIAVPASWGFAIYNFKFKKILFSLYIVLMLMPFQVTMVSNYLVLDKINIMNTHYSIILPAVFSAFPIFIMIKFFSSIPKSIIEAARIDGANEFQIFIFIGIPLGSSGIMSAVILGFLEYWNSVEQPLTFLQDKSRWPLSLFVSDIVADNAGVSFVASAIMMIPALLIFLFGQTYLEQGISVSGLKE